MYINIQQTAHCCVQYTLNLTGDDDDDDDDDDACQEAFTFIILAAAAAAATAIGHADWTAGPTHSNVELYTVREQVEVDGHTMAPLLKADQTKRTLSRTSRRLHLSSSPPPSHHHHTSRSIHVIITVILHSSLHPPHF